MSYMLRMLAREDRKLMTTIVDVVRGVHPDTQTVQEDLECIVRPSQRATRQVQSGAETVSLHIYEVTVPHDAPPLHRADVLTVKASRDSYLVGRHLVVIEVLADDWHASRRLVCQEGR